MNPPRSRRAEELLVESAPHRPSDAEVEEVIAAAVLVATTRVEPMPPELLARLTARIV